MKWKRLGTIAAAAIFAAASGMTARAQDDAATAKLVAAAKKEGTVVLYASTMGVQWQKDTIAGFEKKYGIKVQLLDLRASEINQRIQAEQASGRYFGDILQHVTAVMEAFDKQHLIQPMGEVPNTAKLRSPFKEMLNPTHVPIYVLGYGILINTNLVKPADEPKSWKDLLDPKWKGKILADDFRALGGGSNFFFATYEKFGAAYQEALAKQGIVFSRDVGNDERRVARGEFPMRLPQLYSNYVDLQSLPVKLVQPVEGAPYVQLEAGMLNKAPHPNAARLLTNWYLSDEVQHIMADSALVPVTDVKIDPNEGKWAVLAQTKLLGTTEASRADAMMKLAAQMYGK